MKFIVREDVFGYTDVKLHHESKDKIKLITVWVGSLAAMIGGVVYVIKKSENSMTGPYED